MNLVLDYGNSFVKVGVFDNDELKQNLSFSDVGELKFFFTKLFGRKFHPKFCNTGGRIRTWMGQPCKKKICFDSNFTFAYKKPVCHTPDPGSRPDCWSLWCPSNLPGLKLPRHRFRHLHYL